MDNGNNPLQPMGQPAVGASQPVFQQPTQPTQPTQPIQPTQPFGSAGQQSFAAPKSKKAKKPINSGLIKTIVIVILSLLAVTFIGLFTWMYIKWDDVSTDVEGQIEVAVAEAEYNVTTKLETEFEEREKYPYKTFAGPADFGGLTFEYPKTWSVYIPDDASRADDYHAYLNPDHVNVVADETVMALRVSILNTLMDEVLEDYNDKVQDGEMVLSTTVVNGSNVNVYTGLLDSDLMGIVCIFKIRDKTVILQTDAYAFENDFYKILGTVRYNS